MLGVVQHGFEIRVCDCRAARFPDDVVKALRSCAWGGALNFKGESQKVLGSASLVQGFAKQVPSLEEC